MTHIDNNTLLVGAHPSVHNIMHAHINYCMYTWCLFSPPEATLSHLLHDGVAYFGGGMGMELLFCRRQVSVDTL